ncbi:uncharacterized protein MONOS_14274 [Monocercomonoides exilis]|uniref:uncharacterized protein n=1 Tax=Monocercomonoides exilis TaxID=2049356 RepID=UPI00355A7B90|nr:hypothetical protein MONOS_14274 [Monocercomonoides exilis]|eukprot:MONOS_14274.1-p1 / transcript=MONOS_14274.1 / gene=MONOS_14274 / organism=Monocercomonoides_exilis_PA203 / gene_product=unspecified product / transcript_product=unspecified product / location=Mono_scaffold00969:4865-5464(+) / protein_length=199 / sequence_SO=supercontig / SO=protein_coding / is_pseudo=false
MFFQDIAKLSERKVLIRSDNTSVVYNINRWGAGKNLRPLLKEIRKLVESQGIQVKAVHIAGKRNVEADALSRLEQSRDYEIKNQALQMALSSLRIKPTLDAFDSAKNRKLQRWCGPGSRLRLDGQSYPRKGKVVQSHPPIPLILRTMRKVLKERAKMILLIPYWKNQIWSKTLQLWNRRFMTLRCSRMIFLPWKGLKAK